jgi:hypothetical protein
MPPHHPHLQRIAADLRADHEAAAHEYLATLHTHSGSDERRRLLACYRAAAETAVHATIDRLLHRRPRLLRKLKTEN